MGFKTKHRELRECKWAHEEKKKKDIFGNEAVGRFKSCEEVNKFARWLNLQSYQSERDFEKRLELVELDIDVIFWKNYPILNTFFIDFFEPKRRIAIEIDGSWHNKPEAKQKDKVKDDILKRVGVKVFRIKHPSFSGFDDLISYLKNKFEIKVIGKKLTGKERRQIRAQKRDVLKSKKDEFDQAMILWSLGKGPSPFKK